MLRQDLATQPQCVGIAGPDAGHRERASMELSQGDLKSRMGHQIARCRGRKSKWAVGHLVTRRGAETSERWQNDETERT